MNDIAKAIEWGKSYIKEQSYIQDFNQYDMETLIKIAEKQLTNGWIPVSERLPEEYRDEYGELIPFLVCVSETEYPFRAFYDGKKWGDGMFKLDVTAWQPLPKPYKAD